MIAVREFTSAAECIAHANAVHRKFFAPQVKKSEDPVAELVEIVDEPRKTPGWRMKPVLFDEHVAEYRRFVVSRYASLTGDCVAEEKKRPVQDIINAVLADFPGVTIADIRGKRRNRNIIVPRHIAIYEIYTQRKDLSLPWIGRYFGGRDHSTCWHAVNKISAQRKSTMGEGVSP